MKKFFLSLLTTVFILNTFGQLNPVKNVDYWHGYDTPINCFIIKWDIPETSIIDTLIGYNIYHKDLLTNDSIYFFTTSTNNYCDPCALVVGAVDSNFCDFMSIVNGPFEMFVTAVYNSDSIESDIDTVIFDYGMVINIKELKETFIDIYPNPSTGNVQITINNEQLGSTVQIININGKTVYTSSLRGTKQSIDLSQQAKGIYFIKLIGENGVSTQKLILE